MSHSLGVDVMRSSQFDFPLSRHLLLQTADVTERSSIASRFTVPHHAELLGGTTRFHSTLHGVRSRNISLLHTETSGSIVISGVVEAPAYLVALSAHGGCAVRTTATVCWLTPEFAVVLSPGQAFQVSTSLRAETLFVRISAEVMQHELQAMLGGARCAAPVQYSASLPMRSEVGNRFLRAALRLCRYFNREDVRPEEVTPELETLERRLVTILLDGHRHNYSRKLAAVSKTGPWQLRIAEEFIRANAHLPLSLDDVAATAGVSARTLQHTFHQKRGFGPMRFLHDTRLEMARHELLDAPAGASVSQVASRWGFLHFGRFAATYQGKYGEKPSQTLQKSQKVKSAAAG